MMRSGYHDKRIDREPNVEAARNRLNKDFGGVDLHFLRPPYDPVNWAFYRNELIPFFIPKDRVAAVQAETDDFIRKFAETFAGPDGMLESGAGPNGAKMRNPIYKPAAKAT